MHVQMSYVHCEIVGIVAVHQRIYRIHLAMILSGGSIHTLRNMSEVRNSVSCMYRCCLFTLRNCWHGASTFLGIAAAQDQTIYRIHLAMILTGGSIHTLKHV